MHSLSNYRRQMHFSLIKCADDTPAEPVYIDVHVRHIVYVVGSEFCDRPGAAFRFSAGQRQSNDDYQRHVFVHRRCNGVFLCDHVGEFSGYLLNIRVNGDCARTDAGSSL